MTEAVPTVSSGLRREYCCFFLKFYNPGHNGYKRIFNWRHHRLASKKFFWLVTSKLSLATRLVSSKVSVEPWLAFAIYSVVTGFLCDTITVNI